MGFEIVDENKEERRVSFSSFFEGTYNNILQKQVARKVHCI
jgi:hypothetical protein